MRHATVCAQHRYSGVPRRQFCMRIQVQPYHGNVFRLVPGGKVVVHFNQLVVANAVVISKSGFMTLCEVDVLGTKVELTPDGLFYISWLLCDNMVYYISHKAA